MQLIPLTGTITPQRCQGRRPQQDATHTPHGDDNGGEATYDAWEAHDATHTPHGDDNVLSSILTKIYLKDATHTPHGDDNRASI